MVALKFDRYMKVIFMLAMMLVCAFVFWRYDPAVDPDDPLIIASFIVMLGGVATTALMMNRCMKDVLSFACITIGLYMLVRFAPILFGEGDILAFFAIAYVFIALAIIGFGVNLWAGIEFNIVRIRFIALATMAASGAFLYFNYVMKVDRITWILENWYVLPLIFMALALFLVANDKSLGFVSATTNLRHSVRATGRRLYAVDDAYIITSQALAIVKMVKAGQGEAELLLRSHTFGDRVMKIGTREDGMYVEINSGNHTYYDPLTRMRIVHASLIDDKYLRIYGEDGYWMRIIVYDQLQQDMNKPVLGGKYVDVNKVLGKIFGGIYKF